MSELTYEVEEHTTLRKTTGPDITELKLIASKRHEEMSEDEKDLWMEVKLYGEVPDDAEAGDVYLPTEVLPDGHQTAAERDQAALDEAAETGDVVVISEGTTGCNDDDKECSLDRVARVATPEGDIEKRRTHTY